MEVAHPEFIPDASLDQSAMRAMQEEVRSIAAFEDGRDTPVAIDHDTIVAGIDQALDGDEIISAIVAIRGGTVIERTHARKPLILPYIPGFLSFREAACIIAAARSLSVDPDLLMCDGNGRLHPREAGLATHVGVTLDMPTIGVAKRLLCGQLVNPPEPPFPVGTQVDIVADDAVDVPNGTPIGRAVQTRQWPTGDRHINPIYVSSGHRISLDTAVDGALACCTEWKLPDPIRLADRYAGEYAANASQ